MMLSGVPPSSSTVSLSSFPGSLGSHEAPNHSSSMSDSVILEQHYPNAGHVSRYITVVIAYIAPLLRKHLRVAPSLTTKKNDFQTLLENCKEHPEAHLVQ